jgi:glycosyltransferase involved in cell wall biosynthesis
MKIFTISARFGGNLPSSYHISDRVVELLDRNVQISLLASIWPAPMYARLAKQIRLYVIDPDVYPFLTYRLLPSWIYRLLKRKRLRSKAKVSCSLPDQFARWAEWSWEPTATRFVFDNVDLDDYDLVYSSGGLPVAHLVAFNIAARRGLKWVAEIQDPVIYEALIDNPAVGDQNMGKLSQVENSLRSANALVCLTEECMRHYQKKLGKQEVFYIYPGSNIKHCSKKVGAEKRKKRTGRIRFFYAGKLEASRNLETFIEAVVRLNVQDMIELIVAGPVDGRTSELVKTYSTFIKYIGIISREEVAAYALDSDVCLVIQHLDSISELTIPSKFYEYAALHAVVLFLGYRNREIEANSEKYGFYYADQSSIDQVVDTLDRIVRKDDLSKKGAVPIEISDATTKFLSICERVVRV